MSLIRQRSVAAPPQRRGFVLVAVLIIVSCAVLMTVNLLRAVETDVASTAASEHAAQARALAWSGVQAVMSRLNDQRDRMLQSDLPQLDEQYVIYETAMRAGVVRLLPMSDEGLLFSPESGKLDLNSADTAALGRTGLIDPAVAAAIVAYRDQTLRRPFQSIGELLQTPGGMITGETLFGPLDAITLSDDARRAETDLATRVRARLGDSKVGGLDRVLTVHSCEPALQSTGRLRINLNAEWSDSMGAAIEERFGSEVAALVKSGMSRGAKFERESKIVDALIESNTPLERWPDILDAFTTDSGEYHFGRLDINNAPVEALLALPGITAEQAAQLVRVRAELAAADRASIAWPVIAQVLPKESLSQLAGLITTRCWIYRVRIAAGEVSAEAIDGEMLNPMIYEAVIDLSAPEPRVAYLRDVSQMQVAASLAANMVPSAATDPFAQEPSAPPTPAADSGDPASSSSPSSPPSSDAPPSAEATDPKPAAADSSPEDAAAAKEPEAAAATAASPSEEAQPNGNGSASTKRRIGRWTSGSP